MGYVGSNGDFQPISRYIPETVKDRDIYACVLYWLMLFLVTLT